MKERLISSNDSSRNFACAVIWDVILRYLEPLGGLSIYLGSKISQAELH